MSDTRSLSSSPVLVKNLLPDLPLVVWMVALALVLGIMSGKDAGELVSIFNNGFGRALGEFALILLPSFVLAAALSRQNVASEAAGKTAALASPVAGAGMICPDTAYAALSPAAGRYKLDSAFGAYAGFKLLYPAGPLIVAAGLGSTNMVEIEPLVLLLCGAALTIPVWLAGVMWARSAVNHETVETSTMDHQSNRGLWMTFAPFIVMASLLVIGGFVGKTGINLVDFVLLPKGALMVAATMALLQTPSEARRDCLDSAVRRTGSLLLVIGAASAFGAIVTGMVAFDRLVPPGNGILTLLALFVLTVAFKMAQGSSMATFAAVAPVAAPIVAASGINPVVAVFAICLGSFVAILPNDSYYWLVRRDALETQGERQAIRILAGGATVQALTGLVLLILWVGIAP